jgi:hypothetical protein
LSPSCHFDARDYLEIVLKNPLLWLLSIFLAAPALAGPCAALDYQEMKDMSADELTVHACNYRDLGNQAFSESVDDIDRPRGAVPNTQARSTHGECDGQLTRIQRVLEAKGVSKDSLLQTCVVKTAEKKAAIQQLLNKQ